MGHHIMELARDPESFLRGGLLVEQRALALQPRRALALLLEVRQASRLVQAERQRGTGQSRAPR